MYRFKIYISNHNYIKHEVNKKNVITDLIKLSKSETSQPLLHRFTTSTKYPLKYISSILILSRHLFQNSFACQYYPLT